MSDRIKLKRKLAPRRFAVKDEKLILEMTHKNERTKEITPTADLTELAEENGLSILVVDESSSVLSKANNNSICEILYNSETFASDCAEFCGKAFEMTEKAGAAVDYKCYAGLNCTAVPLETEEKKLAAIVGRIFLKAEDYRKATERAISGDWKQFPPTRFFENVLLSGSPKKLRKVAERLENLTVEEKHLIIAFVEKKELSGNETPKNEQVKQIGGNKTGEPREIEKLVQQFHDAAAQTAKVSKEIAKRNSGETEEFAAWRSLFGSLLDLSYKQACIAVLQFVSKRYKLKNLAWLERKDNHLNTILAGGELKKQQMYLSISAGDKRLIEAVKKESSIELQEREDKTSAGELQKVRLFPVAVGGEIRSALVVGDDIGEKEKNRHIAKFCQTVASELEILRLREELARRGWLERAVQLFNQSIKDLDSEDFWASLLRVSAELMKAERSSLLIFNEETKSFQAKAATGINADSITKNAENIGERVAEKVLQNGKPLVVENIDKIKFPETPEDWNYKSNSFISYPILIGNRKIGVLNLTDKADGDAYNLFDLELLDAIAPQLAILVDRATLKHKAGEFEQLSVTDALTGLLNRRYLEQRLNEEIIRSNRNGSPMSFLMIDVDEFKSYNDNFSHPEGDKALQIVAKCLHETLRGADVAARYGGEEFSILLPQTNSEEAEIIAERVRERVEMTKFPNRKVTISIGIASCCTDFKSTEDLVSAADKALYVAKRQGRNNVKIFEKLDN